LLRPAHRAVNGTRCVVALSGDSEDLLCLRHK
jgi:hypothetical protein